MLDQNIPTQQPNQVPQTEKPKSFLFRKLNPKITYPLVVIFGLIAIALSGYFLYQAYYGDKSTVASVKENKTTLTIESEPEGITIHCNMTEDEITPYDCELPDDATETVIVAPKTYEKDDQTYIFQFWDGCSESNEDMKVCKVKIEKNKKIKANFSSANIANGSDMNNPDKVSNDCEYVDSDNDGYINCSVNVSDPTKVFLTQYFMQRCGVRYYDSDNKGNSTGFGCTEGGEKEYPAWGNITPKPLFCDNDNSCTDFYDYYDPNKKPGRVLVKVPLQGIFHIPTHGLWSAEASAVFDRWDKEDNGLNVYYAPSTNN